MRPWRVYFANGIQVTVPASNRRSAVILACVDSHPATDEADITRVTYLDGFEEIEVAP